MSSNASTAILQKPPGNSTLPIGVSSVNLRANTPKQDTLIVLALSANMLARSARRNGWRPLSLDLFADEDTRRVSRYAEAIPKGRCGFDDEALIAAVERADPRSEALGIVYGSGLDLCPDLLEKLGVKRRIYGNSAATVRLMREPQLFISLLDNADVPHPETRFLIPPKGDGWLVKSRYGEGGRGVARLGAGFIARGDVYFQRYIDGDTVSVLFLADGRTARVIGYNTQWASPASPFLFGRIVNHADLSEGQRALLRDYVERLVAATALVGLNTLDCVLDGDIVRVLEVNPRPGASLVLYDEDYPRGLLAEHVRVCRGGGIEPGLPAHPPRGYEILYAPWDMSIPEGGNWPDWCFDRPAAGMKIFSGQPVCSIRARAGDNSSVLLMLEKRKRALLDLLAVGRH